MRDSSNSTFGPEEVTASLQFDHDVGQWFLNKEDELQRPLRKDELREALEYAGIYMDATFVTIDTQGLSVRLGINGMYERTVACIRELEKIKNESLNVGDFVHAVRESQLRFQFIFSTESKLTCFLEQLSEGMRNTTPISKLPWASPEGRAGRRPTE